MKSGIAARENKMKTCLVVDDSRVVRKVAGRIVQELGFVVVEADDGEQAYALCQTNMPEVILLDWKMPGTNGFDFLKQLRAMEGGRSVKVVFCTAENDAAQIQKAIQAGADEYIIKPFDNEIIKYKFVQIGLVVVT